jgi:DNA-binding NarL/FixJ family response regulator
MSGLPEAQYARIVLRAAASGYFSKGDSAEEFLKAVRTVLLGRHYLSAAFRAIVEGITDFLQACLWDGSRQNRRGWESQFFWRRGCS